MQDPANELRRIPLLSTWVNKGEMRKCLILVNSTEERSKDRESPELEAFLGSGLVGGRPAFDWLVWSGSHPESLHLTECRRYSSPPLSCPPRPAGLWSGVTNVPYPFRLRMAKVEPRKQVTSPNLACSGFPEVLRRLKWLVKRFITKARIEVL